MADFPPYLNVLLVCAMSMQHQCRVQDLDKVEVGWLDLFPVKLEGLPRYLS